MKKMLICVFAAFLLVFTSCVSFTASHLAYGNFDGEVVGTFDTSVNVWKYIGSAGGVTFLDLGQEKTDQAIRLAIRDELDELGADAAINVTIEQEASLFDLLINGVTEGILSPVTIHISGTAIKY